MTTFIIQYLVWAFWIFLPAGIANMSPVLANKIPQLNRWKTPFDLHLKWHGSRLLGDNKTWRGVVFGTAMAVLTILLQQWAVSAKLVPSYLDADGPVVLIGIALGV